MGVRQIELFPTACEVPDGFVYEPDFISRDEETALIASVELLQFAEIKMHGVIAKRRAAHFGRGYEYQTAQLASAAPIPQFLLPLRQRVAEFASREAEEFAEALVSDYPAGAGIGWHRDAPPFEIVVGVSLLAECTMQFRRWPVEKDRAKRPKTLSRTLEPRSAYLLQGPSRTSWQHHSPAIKSRRYSITFRTLRGSA